MEEWEAKAPLGEVELRSVNLVKAANEKTPLPSKVRTLIQPRPAHSNPFSSSARKRVLRVLPLLRSETPNIPSPGRQHQRLLGARLLSHSHLMHCIPRIRFRHPNNSMTGLR